MNVINVQFTTATSFKLCLLQAEGLTTWSPFSLLTIPFSLKEATTFLLQNQVINFTNFREYLLSFYLKNLQLPF